MLSAAKVKVHGMQDRRWVTSDKLTQYRGVIKLFGIRSSISLSQ